MRKKIAIFMCLLVVMSMVVASAVVVAKGKPPKPPPDPPPEGTVFFQYNDGGSRDMYTMSTDGSQKTKLDVPAGIDDGKTAFGEISRLEHGGHYWFIRFETVGGEYPDGDPIREIFAVRDDGDGKVQLTDDPTLATNSVGGIVLAWGIDDNNVTWKAKRWVGEDLDMDSFGIYSIAISFDDNGDVIKPDANVEPTLIWNTGTHMSGPKYNPNVKRIDWSPDGNRMVLAKVYHTPEHDILYEMFVVDIGAQTETDLGTTGYRVRWSPDGSKIAFIQNHNLRTINPDGTDEEIIVPFQVKGPWERTVQDKIDWSPTGSHLVYTWRVIRWGNNGHTSHYDVNRVEANGDNPTSMTDDLPDDAFPGAHGWR